MRIEVWLLKNTQFGIFSDKLELTEAGVELCSKVIGVDAEEIGVEDLSKLLSYVKSSRRTKKFEVKFLN